jgi:hypothetical protein
VFLREEKAAGILRMANDIELGEVRGKSKPTGEAPEDTDYKPVNWKRLFLTPKYIRTSLLSLPAVVLLRVLTFIVSMAHHRHRRPHLHHLHYRPPR